MGTTLRLRLRYVPIQYKTNSKKMIIFETKFNLHYTLLGILPSLLQIWVNEPNILYQKALCLIRMNQPDEALANFHQIIALRPCFAGGYYGAATACVAMGQWEQAFDYIEKTIALDSENSEYFLLRGRILIGLNRTKEACKDFKKAKKMGNQDAPFALYNYCK